MQITAADLTILIAYLLGVVLFGMWMGRGARTLNDYAVGGRRVPWWVVLLSIVATETSTVTFLSVPAVTYGSGSLTWLQLPLGFIVGRFLVVGLLLPHYFRGKLLTAYEVLRERFGGSVQQAASVLFLITRNIADGLRLFLTAIVLEQVAGIDLATAVVCIGVATIVYTFLGGMKAVVWTDFLQFLVYMAGAVLALGLILDRIGGWDQLVAVGTETGKLRMLDFRFDLTDPFVFWAGLIGGAFLSFGTHGADQLMVQRYLCARSQAQAGLALGLSGIVVLMQFAVFLLIGIALFAFYRMHPPETAFASGDRVFASFIVDEIPAGLRGILLGAVFSAAMSTLSSSLNSSATTAVQDLYKTLWRPDAPAATQLRLVRILTVVFGVVQIGVGIAAQWTGQDVVTSVLTIAGLTTGIVLGIFLLGVLTHRVGSRAALLALVVGITGMLVVAFATPLAWPWFAFVGSLGTFALGCLFSVVLPARS